MQEHKDQQFQAPPSYGAAAQQPTGQGSEYPMENVQRAQPAQNPAPHMMKPPQQQQQQATPLGLLRDTPQHVFCPVKGHVVQSRAESKDGDKTWYVESRFPHHMRFY